MLARKICKNQYWTGFTLRLLIAVLIIPCGACSQKTEVRPSLTATLSETTQAVISGTHYDWSKQMPGWDKLDQISAGAYRKEPLKQIKGIVTSDLTEELTGNSVDLGLIDRKLVVGERINANTYIVRIMCVFRNDGFYALRPESNDASMRLALSDCILAKKAGMHVWLEADFIPGSKFRNVDELTRALEMWQTPLRNISMYAERYAIDYFDPFLALDNILANGRAPKITSNEASTIFNQYHARYAVAARTAFKGKLVSVIDDYGTTIRPEVVSLNRNGADIIGLRIVRRSEDIDLDTFRSQLSHNVEAIADLSASRGLDWAITEAKFFGQESNKAIDQEWQAQAYQAIFDSLGSTKLVKPPLGVIIDSWDVKYDKAFADIRNRPAERVIADEFRKE